MVGWKVGLPRDIRKKKIQVVSEEEKLVFSPGEEVGGSRERGVAGDGEEVSG